ncbi:BRCT domain-containing protein [Senna tora]|uniref:BRCT domain-containing protein n=1 Tax=Senna tora TaxID=362788 RepID=A0A834THK2_9FABA|nr:BRCT domain-containing protein [Senna tora]
MESVVATVSGYNGLERFNLIKLISHAGANYVGAMSKSITHLICWQFEGKKYNLARQFKTVIVNHQWIEDCIKLGTRVPEESYTIKSGQEVGPLLLEVPVTVQASTLTKNKVLSHRSDDIGSKKQITEFSSWASRNSVWEDSYLINKHQGTTTNSSRKLRKAKRKISDSNGVATISGRSRQRRRLVKNNVHEVVLDPLLDLNPEDYLSRTDGIHTDAAASSSLAGGVSKDNILENREGSDIGSYNQNGTSNGASNAIEHIKDSNYLSTARISTMYTEDALPTIEQTSADECFENLADGGQPDHGGDLPTSELSCVICLTEFSSTRGVLPCGHRFCYSCIQTWVDHRTTMGKFSTCPLCKSSFDSIIKYEDAATDQKVYSQTIPCGLANSDIIFLMDREPQNYSSESSQVGACVVCRGREPLDLLLSCHLCDIRKIHSYCLDPYLVPWTCSHCKDLQMLYHNH